MNKLRFWYLDAEISYLKNNLIEEAENLIRQGCCLYSMNIYEIEGMTTTIVF